MSPNRVGHCDIERVANKTHLWVIINEGNVRQRKALMAFVVINEGIDEDIYQSVAALT